MKKMVVTENVVYALKVQDPSGGKHEFVSSHPDNWKKVAEVMKEIGWKVMGKVEKRNESPMVMRSLEAVLPDPRRTDREIDRETLDKLSDYVGDLYTFASTAQMSHFNRILKEIREAKSKAKLHAFF